MSLSSVDKWIEQKTNASNYSKLKEYQIKKLNETLLYVKENSTYYKNKLANINFPINDISELPFTESSDLYSHYKSMICVSQGDISRVVTHSTSGTTSSPKRIFFTENDMEATIDFFHHGMMEFTKKGDNVLILFPCEKRGSIGQLLAASLGRMETVAILYGLVTDFDDLIRLMSVQDIDVIVGLPRQILELARIFKHNLISGVKTPHSVLLSADYVADSIVCGIEESFDCVVYEHFGMTETCYGGGVYSKSRDGYHLRHNDFIFEIVDPDSNLILRNGEYGEIVFTSLNTEALPLIRYKTGDIARFSSNAHRYPVMEKIKRRVGDSVLLSNGEAISMSELDEIIFSDDKVLDFFAEISDFILKIYVRSLDFGITKNRIYEFIQDSRLDKCALHLFQTDKSFAEKNTMNKRRIHLNTDSF